jgi:CRISPR-associated protein Cas5t
MLGLHVTVPVACFRKGMAREFLETEPLPPPSTCYGFLLSFVGEADRFRHVGVRVSPVLLNRPELSVVLRTVWRVKKATLGSAGNSRPDFQQLLAPVHLLMWLDSSGEVTETPNATSLERRVEQAIAHPASIKSRFGGLCLGESTHMVDEVNLYDANNPRFADLPAIGNAFLLAERGRLSLPVWVDHVGSAGTRYVTGNLVEVGLTPPSLTLMPQISP